MLFFQWLDNDLFTTTGRPECWKWRLLHFQATGYWRLTRSQRWQIYNLWRPSVSLIIRQLNHKAALASGCRPFWRREWCLPEAGEEEKGWESSVCFTVELPTLDKYSRCYKLGIRCEWSSEWKIITDLFYFIHWSVFLLRYPSLLSFAFSKMC